MLGALHSESQLKEEAEQQHPAQQQELLGHEGKGFRDAAKMAGEGVMPSSP